MYFEIFAFKREYFEWDISRVINVELPLRYTITKEILKEPKEFQKFVNQLYDELVEMCDKP